MTQGGYPGPYHGGPAGMGAPALAPADLGKRVCEVRVVQASSGQRAGVWQALGREFFWLVDFPVPIPCLLNPLWWRWDKPLRQSLHDKVAGAMTLAA